MILLSAPTAWSSPLVGPEWEFTDDDIYENADEWSTADKRNKNARDRLAKRVQELCPECQMTKIKNGNGSTNYMFTLPNSDFYFIVDIDPGVVEIRAKPVPLETYRQHRALLQTVVFDAAKGVGLKPRLDLNCAGHIHFDIKTTFNDDVILFANFLKDFWNHSEIANGILEYDYVNAPPIQTIGMGRMAILDATFKSVQNAPHLWTIESLSNKIIEDVHSHSPFTSVVPAHFQALNLLNITYKRKNGGDRGSLEIRSNNAPQSIDEFIQIVELFQERLEFLKTHRNFAFHPLPLNASNAEKLEHFKKYVTESGLTWEPYQHLSSNDGDDSSYSELQEADKTHHLFDPTYRNPDFRNERIQMLAEIFLRGNQTPAAAKELLRQLTPAELESVHLEHLLVQVAKICSGLVQP